MGGPDQGYDRDDQSNEGGRLGPGRRFRDDHQDFSFGMGPFSGSDLVRVLAASASADAVRRSSAEGPGLAEFGDDEAVADIEFGQGQQ